MCHCIAQDEDDLFRAQMSEEALFAHCAALSADLQAICENVGQRVILTVQKRPITASKKTYCSTVMLQSKETYYSVKRDPLQFADF
jgi:hypothetical protein